MNEGSFARKKKAFFQYLIAGLCAYGFFVGYMYVQQKSFVYLASDDYADVKTVALRDFTKIEVHTDDGLAIKGVYMPAQNNMPTIIYFHGNGGNIYLRGYLSEPYVAAGYGFLFAEYRGYGQNPGEPQEEGLYKDARAYLDWMIQQQNIPQDKIVVIGESIGTGVAVQMALEYQGIKALILQAPFTSLPDIARHRMPYLPVSLLATERFENVDKIDRITMPLLVIHGLADTTIPFKFGKALFEAAPEPKELYAIPKAKHDDLFKYGGAQRVMHFLSLIP